MDYTRPAARARLESAANQYVQRTVSGLLEKLHTWQADPVGFGQLYRSKFATWPAWEAFQWPSHVGDLEVDVQSKLRVRRYNLTVRGAEVHDARGQ